MGNINQYIVQNNITGQNDTTNYIDQYIVSLYLLKIHLPMNRSQEYYLVLVGPQVPSDSVIIALTNLAYQLLTNQTKSQMISDTIYLKTIKSHTLLRKTLSTHVSTSLTAQTALKLTAKAKAGKRRNFLIT